MEQENNSRRKFLKTGVVTGIAAAGSLGVFKVLSQDENKKKDEKKKDSKHKDKSNETTKCSC